jgi:hypothetical protein
MKQKVENWDIDGYLPFETYSWCKSLLSTLGFDHDAVDLPTAQDRTAPLIDIYLQLRARVQEHIDGGFQPQLSLLETPTGAHDWLVRILLVIVRLRS